MLAPEALKQRAIAATGLSDFGTAPLDDGLAALVAALDQAGELGATAAAGMAGSLVATLSERLRVEHWLAREPAILEQELVPQILVLGLPRSGTTALSQLLSADPRARSIRRWELHSLTPPPDAAAAEPDPRIAATRAAFAARDVAMPQLRAMLPLEAEDASEHGVLLGLTFRNLHWPSLNRIPGYADWLRDADMDAAYAYLARILKLLQWKDPPSGFWNLKNPVDSFAIDSLLRVFPQAPIFWMHRDPAKTIPSVCSLLSMLREAAGIAFDRREFGAYILEFEARLIDRAMERRAASPDRDRVVDIYNRDLGRDPFATLRDAFVRAGIDFTAEFEAALRDRMRDRPRGQHGAHEYAAEDFGLDTARIRDRFRAYIDRFSVPLEG